MTSTNEQATLWIRMIGVAAILFCTLMIKEGGAVLLWSEPERSAALALAGATAAVFIAFGVYIAAAGGYELRTIVAMTLRSGVWIVFSWLAHRLLIRPRREINT